MSVDTTVYLGWFFVCTMAKTKITQKTRACSKHPSHTDFGMELNSSKFCSECGAPITEQEVPETQYHSLSGVLTSDETRGMNKPDVAFLRRNFTLLMNSEAHCKQNEELIVYDPGVYTINPDNEEINLAITPDTVNNKPSPEVIARLKNLGQYRDVVVRFGSIVYMS